MKFVIIFAIIFVMALVINAMALQIKQSRRHGISPPEPILYITVSGAGEASVNGTYIYTGIVNGFRRYDDGDFYLVDLKTHWIIGGIVDESDDTYYLNAQVGGNPPKTGWYAGIGLPPAPTISY